MAFSKSYEKKEVKKVKQYSIDDFNQMELEYSIIQKRYSTDKYSADKVRIVWLESQGALEI